jgi:glycosyltransferase involved in cell wall biosynthesis
MIFRAPRLRQPLRQACCIRSIQRSLRNFQPDVMHLQHGHLYFNLGLPLIRRIPLVVTIHDPRHHAGDMESRKTPQWIMDMGFRRATRVIVHGKKLAESVANQIGISNEKIHVIPHIAIGDVPQDSSDMPHLPAEEPHTILFFGRIWGYKGLEYLIRAQPIISRSVPELKIVIAGEGEDFSRYRELMADPTGFEVINRWVGDEERAQLCRRAAVVVLPYIEATQSGVVPVAYMFSRPVVATHVGALVESVEHGVTGLLVPPRDVGLLAGAIVELLCDPCRRQEMGRAGNRKLTDECDPARVAESTLKVYQEAIQAMHGPGRQDARDSRLNALTGQVKPTL